MLFNLDEKSQKIIEVLEEEGISYTDVITFQCVVIQLEFELENDSSKTIQKLEGLIKIPQKKKEKLFKQDDKAFSWTLKKLAKNFYKQSELRGDVSVAELLKESIIKSFMQDLDENLYLDSEAAMVKYIKDKNHLQLLNFYLM